MTDDHAEAIALHRWAVIAQAANPRLSPAERGVVVRATAARAHAHPDGSERRYSRNTLDRWIRAWRSGGLEALRPQARADAGVVRRNPELLDEAAALRLELPTRSAAAIADILWHRHGVRVAERTLRAQLRRRGLHREALAAEPKAFGRYWQSSLTSRSGPCTQARYVTWSKVSFRRPRNTRPSWRHTRLTSSTTRWCSCTMSNAGTPDRLK